MTYSDNLTPTQERVIRMLVSAWDDGQSVTYREIAQAFGYRSDETVMTHLRALAAKGWLTLDAYRYTLSHAARERFSAKWQRIRAFPTIGS